MSLGIYVISKYQYESKVSPLTEHPGVGGQHQVGGQRLERLAPNLETEIYNTKSTKYKYDYEK